MGERVCGQRLDAERASHSRGRGGAWAQGKAESQGSQNGSTGRDGAERAFPEAQGEVWAGGWSWLTMMAGLQWLSWQGLVKVAKRFG